MCISPRRGTSSTSLALSPTFECRVNHVFLQLPLLDLPLPHYECHRVAYGVMPCACAPMPIFELGVSLQYLPILFIYPPTSDRSIIVL